MKTATFGMVVMAGALLPMLGGGAQAAGTSHAAATTYVAHLHPMNSTVTGRQATGEAHFVIHGDTMTITVDMKGVPPGVMHWQHFHGFKDNHNAVCPAAAADVNHDGIIDLIETEPSSGETMVPFNADPAAMQVASNTYPTASANGTYQYHVTVSLPKLQAGFAKAFGDRTLDLDRRVVFIHGVPPDTKLPATVASLGTIPAQVTLPIACGKIER
ncbi:MAG: hypothetical protein ACREF3_09140, partial [Acetobacteraceae bacterium]